jgi:hypothetical protein
MSALALPMTRAAPRPRAVSFARELLLGQGVSRASVSTAARALAFLLERSSSEPGPIFISGEEGAAFCDFEPRTWWLVRRKLLALGHLVASAGGQTPSGRPGGRGRKAGYVVAPPTLEAFQTAALRAAEVQLTPSVMVCTETLNETLNAGCGETVMPGRSHHRSSLGDLTQERTSDVLRVLKGRRLDENGRDGHGATPDHREPRENTERNTENVRTSSTEVRRLLETEQHARVRVALVRLLERALLLELFERTEDKDERRIILGVLGSKRGAYESLRGSLVPTPLPVPGESRSGTCMSTGRGMNEMKNEIKKGVRRARAPTPLWSPDDGPEAKATFERVRETLLWANSSFKGTFDVERSSRDTQKYPYEVVRAALSNVLLKKARGYPFESPGAVLWEGITLEDYRLDEFSVASLDEVLRRCDEIAPRAPPAPPPLTKKPLPIDAERHRLEALQKIYEGLGECERVEIDRRAKARAQDGYAPRGSTIDESIFALRVLSCRHELLAAEYGHDRSFHDVKPP